MEIKIMELMDIQRNVNKKVMEKLETPIMGDQFILAFNVELFEYFNAIGTWKWWKHSHTINKEKVLDELADCFAFFLSAIDVEASLAVLEDVFTFIQDVEDDMNEVFKTLSGYKPETDATNQAINELITYIGTDNESAGVATVERFTMAIFIATLLFDDITWDELTDAYKKKSEVNIQRQVENY